MDWRRLEMVEFLQSYGILLLVMGLLIVMLWMGYDRKKLEKEQEESEITASGIGCGSCKACPKCQSTRFIQTHLSQ
jgi:hypothetical protein